MKNEVAELIKQNQKRLANQHRRMLVKKWYVEQKSKARCSVCGESDTSLLTYHHKDPAVKEYDIARLASTRLNIKRLRDEIKKCDVLCVKCHRKTHGHKSWMD